MKIILLALLGCILVVGIVTSHRNNGGHGHGGHGGHGGRGWHGGHGGGGNWPSYHRHGHNNGHHWHHHVPFINIEVHEPQGLEVSMIQRTPNITFFGIEVYVNKDPRQNGSVCDVCQNTTTVTYGKFIVDDQDAVIKKGDVLNYFVLMGDSTNVTRHHLQKLWVTSSIISKCNCEESVQSPDFDVRFNEESKPTRRFHQRPVPSTEAPTESPFDFDEIAKAHQNSLFSEEEITPFECDMDPETNLCRTEKSDSSKGKKAIEPSTYLQREVQILEEIIIQMKDACTSRRTSNFLLLKQAPVNVNGIQDLTDFVKSSLSVSSELQDLAIEIRRVMPFTPTSVPAGVKFEMANYVDKQKVLYHSRMHNLDQVVDYDLAIRRY